MAKKLNLTYRDVLAVLVSFAGMLGVAHGTVTVVQHYARHPSSPDPPFLITCARADSGVGFYIEEHTVVTAAHVVDPLVCPLPIEGRMGQVFFSLKLESISQQDTARLRAERAGVPQRVGPEPRNGDVLFWKLHIGSAVYATVRGIHIATGTSGAAAGDILIDGPVTQGSSGGPVWNERGEVVGLISGYFAGPSLARALTLAAPLRSNDEKK